MFLGSCCFPICFWESTHPSPKSPPDLLREEPFVEVYIKANGTTRTTSTTITRSLTTTTSTTVTAWSSKGVWQYVGSCEVQGKCIIGFEGKCTAIPPRESPVKVVSYEGSTSSALTIDEHQVSSLDQGHVFLASQISGSGSWKVCIEVPMCDDGLALTPVVNCPSNPSILPGCATVEPGGLCKGGECFTSQQLANCEGVAVYQKEMGTTLTLTTTLTQTATSTASIWKIDGPCGVSGACAESPNFPEASERFSRLFHFACFYCHAQGSLRYWLFCLFVLYLYPMILHRLVLSCSFN